MSGILKMPSPEGRWHASGTGEELDLSARELPELPSVPKRKTSIRWAEKLDDVIVFERLMSEEEEAAWEAEQQRLMELEKSALVARAKAEFNTGVAGDLVFEAGDIITEIMEEEGGWWSGALNGERGIFPSTFVMFLPKDFAETLQARKENASGGSGITLAGFGGEADDDDDEEEEEEEGEQAASALRFSGQTLSLGGFGGESAECDEEEESTDDPEPGSSEGRKTDSLKRAREGRGSISRMTRSGSLKGQRRVPSPPPQATTPTTEAVVVKEIVREALATDEPVPAPKETEDAVLAEIDQQAWYHGPISRAQTEERFLADGGEEGWFLVRKSTRAANAYVISQCYDGRIYHNQVFYRDGQFENALVGTFRTLVELINYHKDKEGGLQSVLSTPCLRKG